jgi:hypothetical protein
MGQPITIPSDDPVEIVSTSDPTGDYDVVVSRAAVILTDRRKDAQDKEGRRLERGRPAELTKNEPGESVYAIAAGAVPAEVEIEKTRFRIIRQPPIRELDVSLSGNRDGDSFDTAAGDTYPIDINPGGVGKELLLSIVGGEVSVELDVGGDTITIPVDGKATIDSYVFDGARIKDGGTTPRVAGGWAGE